MNKVILRTYAIEPDEKDSPLVYIVKAENSSKAVDIAKSRGMLHWRSLTLLEAKSG